MKEAAGLSSGKGHRDENFPVASFLIAPQHRGIILAFYRFARVADDVADHASASADEKNASPQPDDRCSNWATTASAITSGSLPAMPGTPIGQVRRAIASAAMPRCSKRCTKRARLLAEPISPR